MRTEIIAINAKNFHKALAPWYLKSYCESKGLTEIGVIENDINESINEITARIYARQPAVAAADLFDAGLLETVARMPRGRVQFEIGIQSVFDKTLAAVNRKTDTALALSNIKKLVSFQNCHIHAGLIAGLPHETTATFKKAVNQAVSARPHMLQIGFLKMLKGAAIRRGHKSFNAIFADFPPYEVYQTETMSYGDIVKLKKIESVIERYYNSGGFASTIDYAITKLFLSPFEFFEGLSDYAESNGGLQRISLKTAYTLLLKFLLRCGGPLACKEIEHHIKSDCLSFDHKGLSLPDEIKPQRNKQAELCYKKNNKAAADIRIEYFEFEQKHKLFIYDVKNPVTNAYSLRDIDI